MARARRDVVPGARGEVAARARRTVVTWAHREVVRRPGRRPAVVVVQVAMVRSAVVAIAAAAAATATATATMTYRLGVGPRVGCVPRMPSSSSSRRGARLHKGGKVPVARGGAPGRALARRVKAVRRVWRKA